MKAANLTPLLIRVRDAGLSVLVDAGDLEVWPVRALTPELKAELLRNKAELVELLTWSESKAHALLRDALAYLSEFDIVEGLEAHEDAVNEAFAARDMFVLRIAVREWAQAGRAMFAGTQVDRGAA